MRGLLLDDSYLYFNSHSVQGDAPMDPTVVRRMARATGAKTSWPRSPAAPTTTCAWSVIRCLIVSDRAYVVPRAGGPVRALDDVGGSLIGVDDTGMLGYLVMSGDRFRYTARPSTAAPRNRSGPRGGLHISVPRWRYPTEPEVG